LRCRRRAAIAREARVPGAGKGGDDSGSQVHSADAVVAVVAESTRRPEARRICAAVPGPPSPPKPATPVPARVVIVPAARSTLQMRLLLLSEM